MRRVVLSPHMGTSSGLCWFAPALHLRDDQQTEWSVGHDPLEGRSLLASEDGNAIDVTHHGEHLFVCFENEVVQHAGSRQQIALGASPDEFFLSVNVVEFESQPLLCLLASSQGSTVSILKFFELVP